MRYDGVSVCGGADSYLAIKSVSLQKIRKILTAAGIAVSGQPSGSVQGRPE
jgi:hypothetical protein